MEVRVHLHPAIEEATLRSIMDSSGSGRSLGKSATPIFVAGDHLLMTSADDVEGFRLAALRNEETGAVVMRVHGHGIND